jgi:hypothetical protein
VDFSSIGGGRVGVPMAAEGLILAREGDFKRKPWPTSGAWFICTIPRIAPRESMPCAGHQRRPWLSFSGALRRVCPIIAHSKTIHTYPRCEIIRSSLLLCAIFAGTMKSSETSLGLPDQTFRRRVEAFCTNSIDLGKLTSVTWPGPRRPCAGRRAAPNIAIRPLSGGSPARSCDLSTT